MTRGTDYTENYGILASLKNKYWAGEMAQQIRALVYTKDPGSIPIPIYMVVHNHL